MSLDSAEHKQGVGSDSREPLWRLKAGLGEGGLREGFRRRSPREEEEELESPRDSWEFPVLPWPPFASGRTSRLLELTGRTRAGHCPPPCPSRSRSPPPGSHPLCSELCMSFPCGAPHPRPVGQSPSAFPLPEVSFCGLDVPQYLISQSLSSPSQCLSVGLPCRLYVINIRVTGAK